MCFQAINKLNRQTFLNAIKFYIVVQKHSVKNSKWSEDLWIKSFWNLLKNLHKNLIKDLLKISKRTLNEIFLPFEALQFVLGHATKYLIHVLGQKYLKKYLKPNEKTFFFEREPRLLEKFVPKVFFFHSWKSL